MTQSSNFPVLSYIPARSWVKSGSDTIAYQPVNDWYQTGCSKRKCRWIHLAFFLLFRCHTAVNEVHMLSLSIHCKAHRRRFCSNCTNKFTASLFNMLVLSFTWKTDVSLLTFVGYQQRSNLFFLQVPLVSVHLCHVKGTLEEIICWLDADSPLVMLCS